MKLPAEKVRVCFLILCVLLNIGAMNPPVSAEMGESVFVDAGLTVEWDITSPKKDYRYEGKLIAEASGTMERTAGKGKWGKNADPVMMFLPGSMTIHYSYEEREYFLGKIPPGGCRERIRKSVSGRFSSEEPQGGSLAISRISSMTDSLVKDISPAGKKFAEQLLQVYAQQPDSFQLTIRGPAETRQKEKLRGVRIRGGKTCSSEYYEKAVPLFEIGLHMQLPESGGIEGRRNWSGDGKQAPIKFVVSLSDIPGAEQVKPAEGGSGISYSVHWRIGSDVGPGFPFPAEEEWEQNSEEDCEQVRNDIEWIKKVIETYEDKELRNRIKNKYGENAIEEYQKAVEKAVADHFKDPETGESPEISSPIQTNPHCTTERCGRGENAPTIDATIHGSTFTLIEYDSGGNAIKTNQGAMDYMRSVFEDAPGGKNKLNGILDHEKQHVADLTSKGYPQTLDEWAEFELRGFRKELAEREQTLKELDC